MHRRSSSDRRKWPLFLLVGVVFVAVFFAIKNFDVPVERVEKEISWAKLPK